MAQNLASALPVKLSQLWKLDLDARTVLELGVIREIFNESRHAPDYDDEDAAFYLNQTWTRLEGIPSIKSYFQPTNRFGMPLNTKSRSHCQLYSDCFWSSLRVMQI